MSIDIREMLGEDMTQAINARDMKAPVATADDAIALMRGAGYVVRSGKQIICYCQSQREAVVEASRKGGVAYKICKEARSVGRPASIELVRIDSEIATNAETLSERVADYVREQIGATYGPLSPLAKQRVVFTLHSVVQGDKGLAFEVYELLYPASNKEQFDRFWQMLSSKEEQVKPVKNNDNHNRESLVQYAETRGLELVLTEVLRKNYRGCIEVCRNLDVPLSVFDNLLSKARTIGEITEDEYNKFIKSVGNDIASRAVERRIGGDVLSLILNNQSIMGMVRTGNEEGIEEILLNMGYDRVEAAELARETISIGNMIKSMASK